MNKNLLIGLGVGLVAYYLLFKHGKKPCSCNDKSPEEMPEEQPETSKLQSECEADAIKQMSTIRFASPEARDDYKARFMRLCLAGKPTTIL